MDLAALFEPGSYAYRKCRFHAARAAARLGDPAVDADDLFQHLAAAVVAAWPRYDPARPPEPFVDVVVHRAARDFRRNRTAAKRSGVRDGRDPDSLPAPSVDDAGVRLDFEAFLTLLPEPLSEIARLLVAGDTASERAREGGLNYKTLHGRQVRLRRQFRSFFDRDREVPE